jgi:RNA polymerase sigma factor (TIGR02999 family)
MNEVTLLLEQVEHGDPHAAERLLPLVYDELRRLADQRLSKERAGDTLQPTALVHEAYLRLVDVAHDQRWSGRGHFFAAAAEAMRRILIERARRRNAGKHGGGWTRVDLERADVAAAPADDLLALDEALEHLSRKDSLAGKLIKLCYYAGLSVEQAAEALGVSTTTAYRRWTFARAWLHTQLLEGDEAEAG